MKKVIIISVRPQHAIRILKGKKTLELRKSIPKNFKGWVYIYVTKSTPYVGRNENYGWQHKDRFGYALYNIPHFGDLKYNDGIGDLNGKIVARFWFDKYDVITVSCLVGSYPFFLVNGKDGWFNNYSTILKKAKIRLDELEKYLGGNLDTKIYAWHIKNLEVFDEPMEIGDFWVVKTKPTTAGKSMNIYKKLTRAPQSWQYAYKGE